MSTSTPSAISVVTDPTLDFVGLFVSQDEATILARCLDWANEGLDPVADADAWVDTREGSHFLTNITPVIREIARLYDLAGTDVPMSGFVLWSWGTYLDDLAAVWDVFRLAGTFATGLETFTGPDGTEITAGTRVGAIPNSPQDPAAEFEVTVDGVISSGAVVLPIQATAAGSVGNVAAHSITAPSTPLPDGVTIDNAGATQGGQDPESDDALRVRVLEALKGKGPGAVRDYVRWAQATAGVGSVHVVPVFNGPGTVLVLVTDTDGTPISAGIVNGLQQDLDPITGQGAGTAPVGAEVSVTTSTLLDIAIAATPTFEEGYSWDGTGGTLGIGADVEKATNAYLLSVPPAGEVVFEHLKGLLATWPGVHDVTAFTVNGAAVNVPVAATPNAQSAVLSSYTVS